MQADTGSETTQAMLTRFCCELSNNSPAICCVVSEATAHPDVGYLWNS
jgi:hypothetical protein